MVLPTTPGDTNISVSRLAPPDDTPSNVGSRTFQRPFRYRVNQICSRQIAPTLVHCRYSGCGSPPLLPHQQIPAVSLDSDVASPTASIVFDSRRSVDTSPPIRIDILKSSDLNAVASHAPVESGKSAMSATFVLPRCHSLDSVARWYVLSITPPCIAVVPLQDSHTQYQHCSRY